MSPIKVDVQHMPHAEMWATTERRIGLSYDSIGVVAATLDVLVVLAVSVLVSAAYHLGVRGSGFSVIEPLISGSAIAGLLVSSLNARGAYALESLVAPRVQVWPLVLSWGTALLIFLGLVFALKMSGTFSRVALLSTVVVGPAALWGQRWLLQHWLKSLLASGQLKRRRVVVVTDRPVDQFTGALFLRKGYVVARVFSVADARDEDNVAEVGEEVIRFARDAQVAEIHIAAEWHHWSGIKTLANMFRALPMPVRLMPDTTAADILSFSQVGGRAAYAIDLQRQPLTRSELALKRCFDIVFAGLSLFALAPLLAAVAVAIRLESPGPVLFRQSRRGFNGRTFKIYKFRSMTVLEDGPVVTQARVNDPRVTRLGRLLRKTSIDELPQLLNVLRGDMSIVGPRPHALAHDDQYTQLIETYAFRQHTKPGITGWAQVNGYRGETPTVDCMERRVEHDLWYITNWSFWLDVRIVIRTAIELARSRNAF